LSRVPLALSSVDIYIIGFFGLLALMVILVVRAIRKLDDDGVGTNERPGLIQRIWEALVPWA
jgi:hypothetical protein